MKFATPQRIRTIFVLLAALSISFVAASADAECRRCKKLKKAPFIGIKSTGQYADSRAELVKLGSKRKALAQGYSPYTGCVRRQPQLRATKCRRPVFGISATSEYLCANQLRPFKKEQKALNKGYVAYQNCDPTVATPTPTPEATPLPKSETFQVEAGARIADKTLDSIIRMPDDTYRGFFLQSDSRLTTVASSVDGLTWGAAAEVQGITVEAGKEQFVGVSAYLDGNNHFVMAFELSVEIPTAATSINRVHRATSNDGITFLQTSEFVLFGDVSAVANPFYPDAFPTAAGATRLYYTRSSVMKSALSQDDGLTWVEEGEIEMRGFSGWQLGADFIQLSNGNVRMYFAATMDSNSNDYKIYSALSEDGRTFTLEEGPVLEPAAGRVHLNPEAVVLPGGKVRLYVTEWQGEHPNQTSEVISALAE